MRRPRATAGAGAAALALAVLLSGCVEEDPGPGPEAVDVSGEFGVRPIVAFTEPLVIREPAVAVVIDGEGPGLSPGDDLLLDWIAFDGSTGEVIAETYSTAPEVYSFTQESLGEDLFAAVSASGSNDRVLYVEPATGADGLPASQIVIVDVRAARAQGTPVQPAGGLPGVTLADDGAPSVSIPGAPPPPDRVEQLLIKGEGAQVEPGAELIVQFTAIRWSDNGVEAGTWGEGQLPQRIDLSESIPGLALGLLDHTVGSQVMLIVPPAEALGTDTLVFVVDILAIVSEPEPDPSASPVPTASVTVSPGATPTGSPTAGDPAGEGSADE